jgi:prepilin-type N-terminal cleavage/methylation domain-containing protein
MKHEEGFSLIELMVVLLIVAILLAISVPTFLGFRSRARRTEARENLVVAAKIESAVAVEGDGYTDDDSRLELLEPALDFSGGSDVAVHVVVADAISTGDNGQVLMYARAGEGGEWQGIRLVAVGPDAGRHTCQGSAKSDVDTMAACSGSAW